MHTRFQGIIGTKQKADFYCQFYMLLPRRKLQILSLLTSLLSFVCNRVHRLGLFNTSTKLAAFLSKMKLQSFSLLIFFSSLSVFHSEILTGFTGISIDQQVPTDLIFQCIHLCSLCFKKGSTADKRSVVYYSYVYIIRHKKL